MSALVGSSNQARERRRFCAVMNGLEPVQITQTKCHQMRRETREEDFLRGLAAPRPGEMVLGAAVERLRGRRSRRRRASDGVERGSAPLKEGAFRGVFG